MKMGNFDPRKMSLRLRRGESGQALIELALILPVMFLLLLGAGQIALVARAAIEVSSAARAGAAYGMQSVTSMGDTTGIQSAAQNSAPNLTGLTTAATYSYVCSDQSAYDAATQTCPDGATVLTFLHVTASVTYDPPIHLPGLANTIPITGTSVDECLYQ